MTEDLTLEPGLEEEQVYGLFRENDDENEAVAEATVEVVEGEVVEEGPEELEVEAEAPEEPEEEEIDELTALRQQLEAAQAQADEYLDDLRRERAAFQNYKKRQENGRAELRQTAQVGLLVQILSILDDMERALEAVPDDQSDQSWVEGILLIQRKFHKTLEGNGVVAIETEPGQPFDPFIHEAVTYEESEDYQEGEIIAVLQRGYRRGERVLRPAMVRVAK